MNAPTGALEYALACAQRGFSLLPLNGKKPNIPALQRLRKSSSWKALVTEPMTETEILDIFGRRYPVAGIGILTGTPSGVIVVDIDDPAAAPEALMEWPTLTAITPRGLHKFFVADVAAVNGKMPWGDVKADGGYVAAPNGGPDRAWLNPDADLCPFSEIAGLLSVGGPRRSEEHLSSRGKRGSSSAVESGPRRSEEHLSSRGKSGSSSAVESALSELVGRLERDPELLARFARHFGRPAVTDRNVSCLLHPPDHKPSARFTVGNDGAYLHRCFHDGASYKLGTLYALVVGQAKPGEMSHIATLIWKARMLADLGLLDTPTLPFAPAPENVPPAFLSVYEQVKLLFALRSMTTVGIEGPLVPEFLASWCGIAIEVAKAARDYMDSAGLIRRVGMRGRVIIWAPAVAADTQEAAA